MQNLIQIMNKPTLTYVLFILILILPSMLAQGGGGGGGGSSGGGGGGRSSGSTSSCNRSCAGDPVCIQRCNRTGSIVGGVIGSVFGSIFVIMTVCMCCTTRKSCWCHKFQTLKKQFNQVEPGAMSQQQYISKRDSIMGAINFSQKQNNYTFLQNDNQYTINATAKITKQEPYLTEIQLTGNDHFGGWTAVGYVLARNHGQMFFWIYKQYNSKKAAGQTGKWQHLVHESTNILDDRIQGKWYYIGYQSDPVFSGTWSIVSSSMQTPQTLNNQKQYEINVAINNHFKNTVSSSDRVDIKMIQG